MVGRLRVSPFEKLLPVHLLPRSRPLVPFLLLVEPAMPPPFQKTPRQPAAGARLGVTHPHAAGIDALANVHWVAVPARDAPAPPPDHPPNLPPHVRSFGTCTADLIALA